MLMLAPSLNYQVSVKLLEAGLQVNLSDSRALKDNSLSAIGRSLSATMTTSPLTVDLIHWSGVAIPFLCREVREPARGISRQQKSSALGIDE